MIETNLAIPHMLDRMPPLAPPIFAAVRFQCSPALYLWSRKNERSIYVPTCASASRARGG